MAPSVWLARHGETEWSRDGRHTSTTDLPLTDAGAAAARRLGERARGRAFALVLTSPRLRARRHRRARRVPRRRRSTTTSWSGTTASYEGVTTATIRETVPGWTVWTHARARRRDGRRRSAPGVDRVIARARAADGDVALFGHSHACARSPPAGSGSRSPTGACFRLDTATVSVLGYERETPVLMRWNA